ncbi:hypothetical protein Sjap_002799 [Stephania japonica]|uniref:serine O-acetyltransferase n=1 Tax=Stephania japonica TaxID=461633 RepID=A0AAP0PUV5_9MAGN
MATCIHDSSHKRFFSHNSNKFSALTSPHLITPTNNSSDQDNEEYIKVWSCIQEEAQLDSRQEPILSSYYHSSILSHQSLHSALSTLIASKLTTTTLPTAPLQELFYATLVSDARIMGSVVADITTVKQRDPVCVSMTHCVLNFKGFHALVAHRIAHKLWSQNRVSLALLIQSRASEVFAVDIHPAARIGRGVMLDHGTGVVIGETAVVGSHVVIMHGVTLGGTGKESGDRHPKIGDGVLVGAGSCLLGPIWIGKGAKIGAGSVVLVREVLPGTTVVGNPGRVIEGQNCPKKLDVVTETT